ncbi:hypothetical protein Tco_1139416 [Tanacetum coccineum]
MTAAMCYKSIGNISYARVLVETDSEKELKNEIKIQYVDKCNNVKGNKKVQVTYDWKPPICTYCKVFGHELWNSKNRGNVNIGNKSSKDDEENKEKGGGYGGIRHDKNYSQQQSNGFGRIDRPKNSRKEYRKKKADADANVKSKEKNKWKVGENVVDETRKYSNKYFVLDSLPEDND